MALARKEYYTDYINENSSDQKKLFTASKRLFGQSDGDGPPTN